MSMEIYAHDWKMLKGERIARWPSKIGEKRDLRVSISTWQGISIGAKHYYVKVEEKKNQWWCEDQNAWVELSCDSQNGGYNLKADVLTPKEAIKVALFFVKLVAGKDRKNHSVSWNGIGQPRWAR